MEMAAADVEASVPMVMIRVTPAARASSITEGPPTPRSRCGSGCLPTCRYSVILGNNGRPLFHLQPTGITPQVAASGSR